jgi:hypothetical protein
MEAAGMKTREALNSIGNAAVRLRRELPLSEEAPDWLAAIAIELWDRIDDLTPDQR